MTHDRGMAKSTAKSSRKRRARWPRRPSTAMTRRVAAAVREGHDIEGAARLLRIPPELVRGWHRAGAQHATATKLMVDFRLALDAAEQELIGELFDSTRRSCVMTTKRGVVQDFRAPLALLAALDPARFNERNINRRMVHASMDDLMERLEAALPASTFADVLAAILEIRKDMDQEQQ